MTELEAVDAAVTDAMMTYGPDGHCDGHTQIAAAAITALNQHRAEHQLSDHYLCGCGQILVCIDADCTTQPRKRA